jgi:glycosyltransferase involved in cell wall biosynthesis
VKVLHLIPSLDYGGAAQQLALLATHLPRDQFTQRVCCLGPQGALTKQLEASGIEVVTLGWTRLAEFRPLWQLHTLRKEFAPEIVHAWQWPSLRIALGLARGQRLLASALAPLSPAGKVRGWCNRKFLNPVQRVTVTDANQHEQFRQAGLPDTQLVRIVPAVAARSALPAQSTPAQRLGLKEAIRVILCVGPLQRHKGYRDAIWALAILRYLFGDLHLVVVGAGPDRPQLEEFARTARCTECVHFVGPVANLNDWLAQAEVVWIPSHKAGGIHVSLDAMAAGRAVVATQLPCLMEIVAEGETGLAYPPADQAALARQTRLLLDDPQRAQIMGEAGRRRAEAHFDVSRLVIGMEHLYEESILSS